MMKKTVRDIDVSGKRVIVRCDFNVPLDYEMHITDDTRIRGALPTIEYLLNHGAAVILMSHLGRPKGKYDPIYSLAPVAVDLSKILGKNVWFKSVPSVIDEEVKEKAASLQPGDIMLLENTRFRSEEEQNGDGFAKELAGLADIFVNDAFGAAHRAHSSTAGIAAYIPSVSGLLIEKEMKFLGEIVDNPLRPFVAILGGAKVADKIKVIEKLIEKADSLLIGGGMAFTFLKAEGFNIGSSMLDEDSIDIAAGLIRRAKADGKELLLPIDIKAGKSFDNDTETRIFNANSIQDDWMGLDIGPETSKLFASRIAHAKTVFWNGPMGVFEMPTFEDGTRAVAEAMANSDAVTIIGGGDSASAVAQFGLSNKMTFISTGGGASLEYIEQGMLPCVELLKDKTEES